MDAGWVRVRYWWANPSLAITEANAHLVGTADAYVPAHDSVVVECPTQWVPVLQSSGHECIPAEAVVPELDPLMDPLEPATDRHVGQKNLHVIQALAGASWHMDIEAMNISPAGQKVTVQARALSAEEMQTTLTSPVVGLSARKFKAAAQPALARLDFAADGTSLTAPQTNYARRLLSQTIQAKAGGGKDCQPVAAITAAQTLEPFEIRKVSIKGQVPPEAQPGDIYGFQLVQRIGDMVTGGYTLYVMVAAEDLVPRAEP